MVKKIKSKLPSQTQINNVLTAINEANPLAHEYAREMVKKFPTFGFGWKLLGYALEKLEEISESKGAYQRAAQLLPNDHEVFFNLGNLYLDAADFQLAHDAFFRAIQIQPKFYPAYFNFVRALTELERLDEASEILAELKKDLSHDKTFDIHLAEAYFKLAGLHLKNKQSDLAESQLLAGLKLNPQDIDANIDLAQLYLSHKEYEKSLAWIDRAIALEPNNLRVILTNGVLLEAVNNFQEIIEYYEKAIIQVKDEPELYYSYGRASVTHGRISLAKGMFLKVLECQEGHLLAMKALGGIYSDLQEYKNAESILSEALELAPADASVLSSLGGVLFLSGKYKQAELLLTEALLLYPSNPDISINLSNTYAFQGQAEKSVACLQKALEFNSNSSRLLSHYLFHVNYCDDVNIKKILSYANLYEKSLNTSEVFLQKTPTNLNRDRLRVGFVSGDFKDHVVSYFLLNVLPHIDPGKFDLVAFSNYAGVDEVTDRLKGYFADWHLISHLNDNQASALINDCDIDILIDLSGHTAGNRLSIFPRRLAPVQLSWLGYWATTGLKSIDYFIADDVGVSEINRSHFIEKVYCLPNTRLCFSPPNLTIQVSSLPALSAGHITFGCFQNYTKYTNEVIDLWAEVLQKSPTARLRIQSKSLNDIAVKNALEERLVNAGISRSRVDLISGASREEYLAAHKDVDLILDTFPFNGGATTCEALWMGVPTITMLGERMIARQGASLLTAAGMKEWVAFSKEDYVSKALLFSSDLKLLSKTRSELRENVTSSPLFDGPLFAKNFEIALFEIWQEKSKEILAKSNVVKSKNLKNSLGKAIELENQTDCNIVSATRLTEKEFWETSALGISLIRHMKKDKRIRPFIAFQNQRGLPEIYNEHIQKLDGDAILIFIHDDVWIDEMDFVSAVQKGLSKFDVIGVAGNRRRLTGQPSWVYLDTKMSRDSLENLSGSIAHGKNPFGHIDDYGEFGPCELLDGVFLAAKQSVLARNHVKFDIQFKFHFYDLDFCRSARHAGLDMGSCKIRLTHQGGGNFGCEQWHAMLKLYLTKWGDASETTNSNELDKAIMEVFAIAQQHHIQHQFNEAALLYREIIKINPSHSEANYYLALIGKSDDLIN